LPRPAWSLVLLFRASCPTGMTGSATMSVDMGSCKHFCPGWPGTVILPIFGSQGS
jgi:hypothetical protein